MEPTDAATVLGLGVHNTPDGARLVGTSLAPPVDTGPLLEERARAPLPEPPRARLRPEGGSFTAPVRHGEAQNRGVASSRPPLGPLAPIDAPIRVSKTETPLVLAPICELAMPETAHDGPAPARGRYGRVPRLANDGRGVVTTLHANPQLDLFRPLKGPIKSPLQVRANPRILEQGHGLVKDFYQYRHRWTLQVPQLDQIRLDGGPLFAAGRVHRLA